MPERRADDPRADPGIPATRTGGLETSLRHTPPQAIHAKTAAQTNGTIAPAGPDACGHITGSPAAAGHAGRSAAGPMPPEISTRPVNFIPPPTSTPSDAGG